MWCYIKLKKEYIIIRVRGDMCVFIVIVYRQGARHSGHRADRHGGRELQPRLRGQSLHTAGCGCGCVCMHAFVCLSVCLFI